MKDTINLIVSSALFFKRVVGVNFRWRSASQITSYTTVTLNKCLVLSYDTLNLRIFSNFLSFSISKTAWCKKIVWLSREWFFHDSAFLTMYENKKTIKILVFFQNFHKIFISIKFVLDPELLTTTPLTISHPKSHSAN